MKSSELSVDTSREQVVDITNQIAAFVRGSGDGLLSVFALDATAGHALIETGRGTEADRISTLPRLLRAAPSRRRGGSGTEADLISPLERLLPRDDRYTHSHGSRGHGADHVLPALVSPSLTVPVSAGRLALGTWQRIGLSPLTRATPPRRARLDLRSG